MRKYELQAYGKNELKRVAKIAIANLLPQLQKYVGKQIETQSGFSKKFVIDFIKPAVVPMLNGFATLHLNNLKTSYGSLSFSLSICLSGGKYEDKTYYCQYFDRSFYVGTVDGFVLTSVETLADVVKNNTLDELIDLDTELAKIDRHNQLKEELSKLYYSIKLDM